MTANAFQPKHLAYKARVEESFRKQGVMATLGASLQLVEPGVVDIALDWAEGLTQQHGFLHAGVVATALDSACGYAGLTLMPEDAAVLTIVFIFKLLAPYDVQRCLKVRRVLKPGRAITVCEGRAFALQGEQEKLVATMACTLMAVSGREQLRD